MTDVQVWWTGLECRVRQEGEDEIFGTIKLIAADGQSPPSINVPEHSYLNMGLDGQRIHVAHTLLYSGQAQDLAVSAMLLENDSGNVEQEKQLISQAVSAAATSALAAYTAGLGALAKPLIDFLSVALVDLVADGILGVRDDGYNPQAVSLTRNSLLQANNRRRTLRRADDPRSLEWTDVIVLSGTDNGGDHGEYGIYLDVRVSPDSPVDPALAEEAAAGTPMIRRGARGPAVRKLQRLLNVHVSDLPPLVMDGQFGPATDGRVREFQRRSALVVDGIVGPKTWHALTG